MGDQRASNGSSTSSDEDEEENAPRLSLRLSQPPVIVLPLVAFKGEVAWLVVEEPSADKGENAYSCDICPNVQGNVSSMFYHFDKHHNAMLKRRLHPAYVCEYIRSLSAAGKTIRFSMDRLRTLTLSVGSRSSGDESGRQPRQKEWLRCFVCEEYRTKSFFVLDRHFVTRHPKERYDLVEGIFAEDRSSE